MSAEPTNPVNRRAFPGLGVYGRAWIQHHRIELT
jgi:hypothetical protein